MRNRHVKTRVKNITKMIRTAAGEGQSQQALQEQLNTAKSIIDNAAKKGVLHRNTAARKISRLANLVNKSAQA